MKKILILLLASASINALAITAINGDCQYIESTVTQLRASSIAISYTEDQAAKAEQCMGMIISKDSGIKVRMQRSDGINYFNVVVLEEYSQWKFWK